MIRRKLSILGLLFVLGLPVSSFQHAYADPISNSIASCERKLLPDFVPDDQALWALRRVVKNERSRNYGLWEKTVKERFEYLLDSDVAHSTHNQENRWYQLFARLLMPEDGAIGEIEALERHLIEGDGVVILPRKNGMRSPDFLIESHGVKQVVELKTRRLPFKFNHLYSALHEAIEQLQDSGLLEKWNLGGAVEIELRGMASDGIDNAQDIERMKRIVDGRLESHPNIHRISIYRDGQLFIEGVQGPEQPVRVVDYSSPYKK